MLMVGGRQHSTPQGPTHLQQAARIALGHVKHHRHEVNRAGRIWGGGGGGGSRPHSQQRDTGSHAPQHGFDEAAHSFDVEPRRDGLPIPVAGKGEGGGGVKLALSPTPAPGLPAYFLAACSFSRASVAAASLCRRPSVSCAASEAPGE